MQNDSHQVNRCDQHRRLHKFELENEQVQANNKKN